VVAEPGAGTTAAPDGPASDGPPFAVLLRRHRRAAGLTQEALAARAGLSVRGVQDLERGARTAPHRETVRLLAEALALGPGGRRALEAAGARRRVPASRDRADGRPPPGPEGQPTNLPAQLTSFVGRERERAAVQGLLESCRLLTLTGTGGCGKTRLALRVAGDERAAYPDGVWVVELASLAEPALVPSAALLALAPLGAREGPGQPATATLIRFLRPRRVLLVLDNCEHLVDACAALADALLRACPGARLLATSRERLGVPGETVWRVPSLALPAPPDPSSPAPDALRSPPDAVRLFEARARAVVPGFRITEGNAGAVAQLCRRLDGIPLAIELAAARVRVLTVAQIVARLDDRFRLLTGGGRTVPRRQQTLQATVDWSHDLLPAPERVLLRRLAVFAGGCTLEAAEAVCADAPPATGTGAGIAADDVLDLLTGLVDKSLLLADFDAVLDGEPGAAGTPAGPGDARYRLQETIRQYAADRLQAAGEAAAVRDRHRAWFAALAHRARSEHGLLDGPAPPRSAAGPPPPTARQDLEREQDNLRAALARCRDGTGDAGSDERARLGLQLACGLAYFWRSHQSGEGFRWVETFLDRWRAPDAVRAEGLTTLAEWHRFRGEFAPARAARTAALAIYRVLDDRAGIARATRQLGDEAATLGDYAAGRAAIEESLATARALGDRRLIAHGLRHLGFVLICTREYRAARALLGESVALGRALGDGLLVAVALLRLGLLDRLEGDLSGSRARIGESLALLEALDLARFARWTLVRNGLGSLALAEGRPDEARAVFAEVLRGIDPIPFPLEVRDQLSLFGILAAAEGRPVPAARLLAAGAAGVGLPGTVDRPDIRVEGTDAVARARAALGPAAFAAAWAEGQAMPLEQAVVCALEGTAAAAAPSEPRAP
jgi:non-specific serine/threonine protein kinase